MKLILHNNANLTVQIISSGNEEISFVGEDCTSNFWKLAERYPDEWICWCEQSLYEDFNVDSLKEVFHHDLVMASFAINNTFLPDRIGYIDHLPFVKVNRSVLYGTWLMSSDMGGIKASTLLEFKTLLGGIRNFEYLLNSVAKIGQQNSLFCYSAPKLSRAASMNNFVSELSLRKKATEKQLFAFVYQHYNTIWTTILLFNIILYERNFPIFEYLQSFLRRKYIKRPVTLPIHNVSSTRVNLNFNTIDVIIPTIGRRDYLYKVLKDLGEQTHLPKTVIIVEQNPDIQSSSELDYLQKTPWPFEIRHLFIRQTGACNARNLALSYTTSDLVFFADDDVTFDSDLIAVSINEMKRLGIQGLTLSCLQLGEEKYFVFPKQWGTFGAGTSIVSRKYLENVKFSLEYEFGYGEDMDFGMQLRNGGCDIIFLPDLEITHLKAPIGGFREKPSFEWEQEELKPKPSPTLMVFGKKHYTREQLKGYKTTLFIRFYKDQTTKNPYSYYRKMIKRWDKSEEWAEKLILRHLTLQKNVK